MKISRFIASTTFLFGLYAGIGNGQKIVFKNSFAPSTPYIQPAEQPAREGICLNGSRL
jgi:hypothetical protein